MGLFWNFSFQLSNPQKYSISILYFLLFENTKTFANFGSVKILILNVDYAFTTYNMNNMIQIFFFTNCNTLLNHSNTTVLPTHNKVEKPVLWFLLRRCGIKSLMSEAIPSATQFFMRAYKISHFPGL